MRRILYYDTEQVQWKSLWFGLQNWCKSNKKKEKKLYWNGLEYVARRDKLLFDSSKEVKEVNGNASKENPRRFTK